MTNHKERIMLPPDSEIFYQLPCDYQIKATEGEASIPDNPNELPFIDSVVLELWKNETLVYSTSVYGENTDKKNAFKTVEPYLLETEGKEKTDWIRKKFCGSDEEKPPWERDTATRDYKRHTQIDIMSTLNDQGNAERFEEEAGGYLIFDPNKGKRDMGEWFAWIDNHWEAANEKVGQTERFIGSTLDEELRQWERKYNADLENKAKSENKEYFKNLEGIVSSFRTHATQSKNQHRQNAMLKMVEKSRMRVNLSKETDHNILAFKNGAVDCRTGKMFEIWECAQLKDRYPMTYIDATYLFGSDPVKFKEHLHKVFSDNTTTELTDEEREAKAQRIGKYFLRLIGYILYAGNPESLFVFLWGEGANGKSKTVDVLHSILGGQYAEAPISELMSGNVGRPAPKTAIGIDKRLLTYPEASGSGNERNKDKYLSSADIKSLTGEKQTTRYRRLHKDGEEVVINCLPIGITNSIPKFDEGLDPALLRRLVMIPFPHIFSGSEQNKDILDDLLSEKDQIFSLMVDELRLYLKEGLGEPPEDCKATLEELLAGYEYKIFVESEYEKTDGEKPEDRTSREAVKTHYIEWCDEKGIDVTTQMKIWGVDQKYGDPLKRRDLIKGEAAKLYNAFKVCGIKEGKSNGKRYFCCKLR